MSPVSLLWITVAFYDPCSCCGLSPHFVVIAEGPVQGLVSSGDPLSSLEEEEEEEEALEVGAQVEAC